MLVFAPSYELARTLFSCFLFVFCRRSWHELAWRALILAWMCEFHLTVTVATERGFSLMEHSAHGKGIAGEEGVDVARVLGGASPLAVKLGDVAVVCRDASPITRPKYLK